MLEQVLVGLVLSFKFEVAPTRAARPRMRCLGQSQGISFRACQIWAMSRAVARRRGEEADGEAVTSVERECCRPRGAQRRADERGSFQ